MSEISLPHLNSANYLYSESSENGIRRAHEGVDGSSGRQVATELGRVSQILAEIPHDETGLDTQRIAGFLERFGLVGKRFVGVDEVGQQAIRDEMGYGSTDSPTIAAYQPLYDFIYVLRGPLEEFQGSDATEAVAVHEQAHANNPFWDILTHKDASSRIGIGYGLLRNGFALHTGDHTLGNYYEEGFAGLMEHKYTVEELGLTNGFLNRAEPVEFTIAPNARYLLPGSYVAKSMVSNKLKWFTSSHAAYGMQLLIARDPSIFPAMLAARKGVDGLREFARRVEALDPGLYSSLRRHPYEEMRFREATRYIIEKLYDGNQEEALAAAREQDSREELIAA